MPRSTVKTEITGKVWKVTSTVGQKLNEDDSIVILDRMRSLVVLMQL